MLRLLLLLIVATSALPIFAQEPLAFPEPTGEHQVGFVEYLLVDENREETFTPDEGDPREIMLSVYYPAVPAPDSAPAPYAKGPMRESLLISAEQVDLVQTHIYADAPAAEDTFPVLIFSPGMGTSPIYYTSLLTEIASHGYVVAAVSHPYSLFVTVLPDDRIIYANESGYLDPFLAPEESEAATERIGAVWVEDIIFALDQLEQFNADDERLAGHLNLEQVGVFGHSFGGGAATQAAYQDSRFQAVLNMDGPLFGSVEGQALSQPLMVMLSTEWVITDEAVAGAGITREEYEAVIDGYIAEYTGQIMAVVEQTSPAYLLRLAGMAHVGFAADDIFFAPLAPDFLPPSSIGSLAPEYAVELISAYATAFFDHHLKGEEAVLLTSESVQYPEADLEVLNPA